MTDYVEPIRKHLKVDHPRKRLGYDTLSVATEESGYNYLDVFVDLFNHHVQLYPRKVHTAETLADNLFHYYMTFGVYDQIITDPGSDILSQVVTQLNQWMGVEQLISLVGRHESNGVEGTNKQILRHIRTLVADERCIKKWGRPSIYKAVEHYVNSFDNSEAGITPLLARFGSDTIPYFDIYKDIKPQEFTHAYIKELDEDLRTIAKKSLNYQNDLIAKRLKDVKPDDQNIYHPGDLILRKTPKPIHYDKANLPWSGPYRVVHHTGNNVQCKHIVDGVVETFFVGEVKMFVGTAQEEFKTAMLDRDQHLVLTIHSYRGDPDTRTTTEFYVEWVDGTKMWIPWCQDITSTAAYDTFCTQRRELQYLLVPIDVIAPSRKQINNLHIQIIQPGDTIYVNLRLYGHQWYETLKLPDWEYKQYMLPFRYTKWTHPVGHRMYKKRIDVTCTLLNDVWPNRDHAWVSIWGANKNFDSSYMILIDDNLLRQHPNIRGDPTSKSLHLLFSTFAKPTPKKSTALTIVTWNVNSLRQRLKHVLGLLTIEEPTVLFLQETKLEDSEFAKITWPSNYHVTHAGMQRFNGVAILSTLAPTRVITILPDCPVSQCRFLQVTIQHFVFINVYMHQGQLIGSQYYQDKLVFLRRLITHIRSLTANGFRVILGGDINIMPTDADLYNPDHPDWAVNAMVSPTERQLFQDILDIGFHDIVAERLPHRPYTRWQHYRSASDRKCGFRLDYFFTPIEFLPNITDVQVLTHWRAMPHPSDHAPVKIILVTTL